MKCHWSKLDGNGTNRWADAHLTEVGIAQAQKANHFWSTALKRNGIPAPQAYYVSPLDRCMQTAKITFSRLNLPKEYPFIPTVKELVREVIGIHTCDRRSSRSYIAKSYPDYRIEDGLTEKDVLWKPDLRETNKATEQRVAHFLDDIFQHDPHTFISITAHSGAIRAMLAVLGHRDFALATGGVIPVLVKADRLEGKRLEEPAPWIPEEECDAAYNLN